MIEEIPKAYRYICDCCGIIHIQKNAEAHYFDSKPKDWGKLKFNGPNNDMSKLATFELLLCLSCSGKVLHAIKEVKP